MQTTTSFVNYVALQSAQISMNGLYHGRMGIILSLYCYGKVHKNHCLCEYTSDVLHNMTTDDYYGDISIESGLSGLALGFTLLSKAGMFKDNLNEILYDVDKKIMSIDPRRMEDYSFRKGALGVLYYIKTRLSIDQVCVSLHKDYIRELEAIMEKKTCWPMKPEMFLDSLIQPAWETKDYLNKDAGIDNGNAYFLIKESYDKVFSRK